MFWYVTFTLPTGKIIERFVPMSEVKYPELSAKLGAYKKSHPNTKLCVVRSLFDASNWRDCVLGA